MTQLRFDHSQYRYEGSTPQVGLLASPVDSSPKIIPDLSILEDADQIKNIAEAARAIGQPNLANAEPSAGHHKTIIIEVPYTSFKNDKRMRLALTRSDLIFILLEAVEERQIPIEMVKNAFQRKDDVDILTKLEKLAELIDFDSTILVPLPEQSLRVFKKPWNPNVSVDIDPGTIIKKTQELVSQLIDFDIKKQEEREKIEFEDQSRI